jgi:dihydroorotate dehydrogenase (NAD+) catalytic subunit
MAIDVRTRRPKIANVTGGLSGPAIRPVAIRMVWQVAQAVRLPILGMGGIVTGEDAVEFPSPAPPPWPSGRPASSTRRAW